MGLRELKKTRTRQAIRQAAMRLFRDQGYEATTVEQIASAAEISTATFYRYYRDKEDVVINDGDRSDFVEEVLAGSPERDSLFGTVKALFEWTATELESDREAVLVRLRLVLEVPALQARRWASRHALANALAGMLAPRAGTSTADHGLRLAIVIALAAESEALFYWARIDGAESLAGLLDQALDTIKPVLSGWPPATGPGTGAAASR
jgi:AcrR family transcriptional regulator